MSETRLVELAEADAAQIGVDTKSPGRHAGRRRVRRLAATGVALAVAVVAIIVTIAFSVTHRSGTARRPSGEPVTRVPHDVLVFDDGLGTVGAVDLDARNVSLRWIEPDVDDSDVAFVIDGNLVITALDSTVYAAPIAGGSPHYLGSGLAVVPDPHAHAVWISGVLPGERLVDLRGRLLLERPSPYPENPRAGVAAAPGGLVFQTFTGLDIWDAHSARITRHLGNRWAVTTPAFGALLPWCDNCAQVLDLTNLTTGVTRTITVQLRGTADALREARWSPDGSLLAIAEETDSTTTARVLVVAAAAGRITEQIDSHGQHASVAWSPDSRRLYIAGWSQNEKRAHLYVHDATTDQTRSLGTLPVARARFLRLAAVLSRDEATHMLMTPPPASAAVCVPGTEPTLQDTRGCRYHY